MQENLKAFVRLIAISMFIYAVGFTLCTLIFIATSTLTKVTQLNLHNITDIIKGVLVGLPLYIIAVIAGSLLAGFILQRFTTPSLPEIKVEDFSFMWFVISLFLSFFINIIMDQTAHQFYIRLIGIISSVTREFHGFEMCFIMYLYILQLLYGFGIGMFLKSKQRVPPVMQQLEGSTPHQR